MLNSKKRNKTTYRLQILVLALGFVCCGCILFLYFNTQFDKKGETIIDIRAQYAAYVRTQRVSALYQKEKGAYVQVGNIENNIVVALDTEDMQVYNENYFKLKDVDAYILADCVEPTAYVLNEKKEYPYIPFSESIKTNDTFTLCDSSNNAVAQISRSQQYPIYIKDDGRYGIMHKENLYFISKDDVASIVQQENSTRKIAQNVPVLMYHYFYSKANNEIPKDGNSLEVNDFKEQLDYLKTNQYTTLIMQDIEYYLDGKVQLPKNAVAITIDDGANSVYKYAYPLLKEYKYHATLFLIMNKFKDEVLPNTFKEMRENGLELQSHSFGMHTGGCEGGHGGRLRCVDYETGVEDTKKANMLLGGGFVYCYPFGDVTESALKIVKDAGVRMAFTTKYGKIEAGMNKLQLPRVRIFGNAGITQFISSIQN